MVFKQFVSVMLMVSLISASPVPYKDCGSDPSIKVTQYDISGCESFPCPFKRNTSITMKFNFTSTQPIDAVYNKLYGIIAGVKVPFPIPNENGCNDGFICPIQPTQSNGEVVSVPILSGYPALSLFVRIELVDQNQKILVCSLFPARIS